ncbi:hypothetical protein [Streptomyces triticisoli]|uniref:hypothetical protein n=1 Tax=Streptomyces triticisoli TaxID=2182797 RepID=UPI000DD90E8A|nr:hypothetical protein [Streptomyces triticisoli]
MHLTLRSRCVRGAAAGALSVALVSVGSAGAVAATDPSPMPTRTHSAMPTAAAKAITIRASHSSIKAGHSVTLTGRADHLAAGAKLTVQHWVNGKWTTLRTTTVAKKGNTYTVSTKLAVKGPQKLRVVHGATHSRTVTVHVT